MQKRVESPALLVRSVAYREADLIATFFTETEGKISALVRGGRRSTKRFGGALEPIHGLAITFDERSSELGLLGEARVVTPRHGIVSNLDAMEAAGHALRWVRYLCPPKTPEPAVWAELSGLFDALDRAPTDARAHAYRLCAFGLRLLGAMGYALDFERCTRCGKACPEARPAFVDAALGGLVCTSCGGARRTIDAEVRALALAMQRASTRTFADEPAPADASARHDTRAVTQLQTIVEEAMTAHTDYDRR